ncbi:Mob1/phocein family protein [Loa loa]|uniref:Mob1/phocein family protein n=1 Tax=Loa loa TaxID=7209 RepID=A0A1I7VAA5_LOALO|nr:Mob1/phocein family protein [Loa loa]EFO18584.2 Mob1/phocein family protein [Loa loa]
METAEDVVDELLDLAEASSMNPVEEFLNDLVQAPPKDMVEESLEDLLEIPSKNKIEEILDDLIEATCKDEVEELLNDIAKTSSEKGFEEKDLTDASTEDTVNQLLAALEEASSRDRADQQLLKDLVRVMINGPIEEILNEMSKKPSFKDSSEISFKNPLEGSPENLVKEKPSEALITELFKDSIKQSEELIPNDPDLIAKPHFLPKNFYEEDATVFHAVRYKQFRYWE